MSIAENLVLKETDSPKFSQGKGLRLNKRAIHDYAEEMVQKYDVRCTSVGQTVRSLSGGNQQKVILARELESQPSLLVMAHPTRGLDIGAASFVHEQMIAARERGVGIQTSMRYWRCPTASWSALRARSWANSPEKTRPSRRSASP